MPTRKPKGLSGQIELPDRDARLRAQWRMLRKQAQSLGWPELVRRQSAGIAPLPVPLLPGQTARQVLDEFISNLSGASPFEQGKMRESGYIAPVEPVASEELRASA